MCRKQHTSWQWKVVLQIMLRICTFLCHASIRRDWFKYFFVFSSDLAKIPVRFNVGLMLFMASFTSYMLRVNFSLIIIAMTKTTTSGKNSTENFLESSESGDDTFNWSKTEQGLLLSAYFYGYIFPNLLGGYLSEKFGGMKVIFTTIFLSAIVTGLSPLTANDNFVFMFSARLVLGVLGVSSTFADVTSSMSW